MPKDSLSDQAGKYANRCRKIFERYLKGEIDMITAKAEIIKFLEDK